MQKLVLIDGNSILNRAFYAIMGSRMLMSNDKKPTNAIFGFLSILFKVMNDENPDYIAVAFDLKAPTFRHKKYEGYKAQRKGMPDELAQQLPIMKDILNAMNIKIYEKEGYEADDILGTLACYGEKQGLKVILLTGDRDSLQLTTENINPRIPTTKAGKTTEEIYTPEKIQEKYGIEPKQFIQVKALMGDSSDNIPGVPGVGEKTALSLIQKFKTLDEVYAQIELGNPEIKGKLKERLVENKELAYLSRQLGTICLEAPVETNLEDMKLEEYNSEKLYEIFKNLNFNKYIEKLGLKPNLEETQKNNVEFNYNIIKQEDLDEILTKVKKEKYFSYNLINGEEITFTLGDITYYYKGNIEPFKEIFESNEILKIGYKLKEDIVSLNNLQVHPENMMFDIEIAAYLLNSLKSKYEVEELASEYLNIDVDSFIKAPSKENEQLSLLAEPEEDTSDVIENKCKKSYLIYSIYIKLKEELEKNNQTKLFETIEMPLVEVLASMQIEGMHVDKLALEEYGKDINNQVENLTNEIYDLVGQEFNINSPKQLGEILFEKLKLPVIKKNKTGYATDVDVLEKLKGEHPVIEKLLEYRQIAKIKSTYVDGLIPLINPNTNRIHSKFHQTVTATGRISSTEPNLQNIPIKLELGKKLRKVFTAKEGFALLDADYSQIELRVLAHISEDTNMINAFLNDEDIHTSTASKVFNVPIEEVTSSQRSEAKAVNFGIVYGISDFGLASNIGISRKKAKEYIENYLDKYTGIKKFMENIVEVAKKQGYVETLFARRRYIPEINSNNFNVRQFGQRVALNTPIQGTAADIIKIAMVNVYKKLKENHLQSKLILQVHDELIIETKETEKEQVKQILQDAMENAIVLKVPLKIDMHEGKNWYDSK